MTYPGPIHSGFAVGASPSVSMSSSTSSVSPSTAPSTSVGSLTIEQSIAANPPNKDLPKATIRNIYKYRKEALLNQKVINNSIYVSRVEETLLNKIYLCNTLKNRRESGLIWEAYKNILYFGDNNITISENLYNLSDIHCTQIRILKELVIILIIALFLVILIAAPYGISLTLGITGRLLERWGLGFLLMLLSGAILVGIGGVVIVAHKVAENILIYIIKRYERANL